MSNLKGFVRTHRFTVHTAIACLLLSFSSLLLIINIVNCTDYECLYGKKEYLNHTYLCFINNSVPDPNLNNSMIYETYYVKARWNCYMLLDLMLFIHFTFYYLGIYLCSTTYKYYIRNQQYNGIHQDTNSNNNNDYPQIEECNQTFIIVMLYFHIIGILGICFYLMIYALFVGIPRLLIKGLPRIFQYLNRNQTIEYEDL